MDDNYPATTSGEEQNPGMPRHVVEVGEGRPGQWQFIVLDPDRWSQLTEGEQKAERHRAIKRRQNRRRARRIRENGRRDSYTLEQIGERDGWRCAICHTPVNRAFKRPHPCSPSVHHVVEIVAGGTDTLGNVVLVHQFCNSDSYSWGQKAPGVARQRLADRVLYGKHGPGRRGRVPDADAVALADAIIGSVADR